MMEGNKKRNKKNKREGKRIKKIIKSKWSRRAQIPNEWKRDWIGPSYSLRRSGRREEILEREKDPMTSKELNEEPYEVKISCTVL